jgi:hypothetical protein
MLFNMENRDRLKSIFDYLFKSIDTNFKIVDTKLFLTLTRTGELVAYTFEVKTTQDFDGIEYQQMVRDLEEVENTLSVIFSKNIINKNLKMSNSENYPNLWVGILINKLNASNVEGRMDIDWEIYVDLHA